MRRIIAVIALLTAVTARAQEPWEVTAYGLREGMSQKTATCIHKDRMGFMWFGTWDGLNRFDGNKFTVYRPVPGGSNRIVSIRESTQGLLWVLFFDGTVAWFDHSDLRFRRIVLDPVATGHARPFVAEMTVASSGEVWLTTLSDGCYRVAVQPDGQPRTDRYSMGGKETDASINFLRESSDGSIWIGTGDGLRRIGKSDKNGKIFLAECPVDRIPASGVGTVKAKNFVFDLFAEQSGRIFLGARSKGLFVCDKKDLTVREVLSPDALPSTITSLLLINDDLLAIGTNHDGLFLYHIASDQLRPIALAPEARKIVSMDKDRHGTLWVTTDPCKLYAYDIRSGRATHFPQADSKALALKDNINVFDYGTGVWICLQDWGLYTYTRNENQLALFESLHIDPSDIAENNLRSVYFDDDEVMWLGSRFGGIKKLVARATWLERLPYVRTSTLEREVRSLCEERGRRFWIGSRGGVLALCDEEYNVERYIDHYTAGGERHPFGMIYGIYNFDGGDDIWLCTKDNGLISYNTRSGTGQRFVPTRRELQSISSASVYAVTRDARGRLWAGTYGGGLNLMVHEGGTTRFQSQSNTLRYPAEVGQRIRSLVTDSRGWVWVGTTDGIVYFDSNVENPEDIQFYYYSNENRTPNLGCSDVSCLVPVPGGGVWYGTYGGGVGRLTQGDSEASVSLTTHEGLPSNMVLGLTYDFSGNLWVATEVGISCYNIAKARFEDTFRESFDNISVSERCLMTNSRGEIVFGCTGGAYRFFPENILRREVRLKTQLTDFLLFGREAAIGEKNAPLQHAIEVSDRIRLAHDQNMIRIEFSALDYKRTRQLRYAYRLDGVESDWQYGIGNFAAYTDLSPGDYTFRVRSSTTNRFDDKPERVLHITILPPFWNTRLAWALYILVGGAILLVVVRMLAANYRLKGKVRMEQELTDYKLQFFTNFSHELITPLTLIVSPLDTLIDSKAMPVQFRQRLVVIQRNANRMLHLISQILEFRKVQNAKTQLQVRRGDIVDFVRTIAGNFMSRIRERGIRFSMTASPEVIDMWFDPYKMDIIVYNLLSNALKYTPEEKAISVAITLDAEERYVEMNFADEGIGIPRERQQDIFSRFYTLGYMADPRSKSTGIGLSLVKALVELHGGEIRLDSDRGAGSTFTVRIPVDKERFAAETVEVAEGERVPNTYMSFGDENTATLAKPEPSTPAGNPQAPLILVVDDNTELLHYLAQLLGDRYRLHFEVNGRDGYKTAETIQPDMILSDVMMPQVDGVQMLRLIRENPRTSHISVILLSVKAMVEDRVEGIETGADDYVPKPFQAKYLLARIENLLQQRGRIIKRFALASENVDQISAELNATSKDAQFLKRVVEYAQNSLTDPAFCIDDISQNLSMSRTNFYNKLKALTGMPPVHFVRDIRLQRAAALLEEGKYSVAEVVLMVGFNDNRHFTNCFKDKFGITPSEYAKRKA